MVFYPYQSHICILHRRRYLPHIPNPDSATCQMWWAGDILIRISTSVRICFSIACYPADCCIYGDILKPFCAVSAHLADRGQAGEEIDRGPVRYHKNAELAISSSPQPYRTCPPVSYANVKVRHLTRPHLIAKKHECL